MKKFASKIIVLGLGYVGLPLLVEFAKKFKNTDMPIMGFDINATRVSELMAGIDRTGEVQDTEFLKSCLFTTDPSVMSAEDAIIIVTVPTPITAANVPDLGPLISSSTAIGKHLKKGSLVIYESTVYPGVTEEVCVPLLESHSGLKWGVDFNVGYSPERINPGDRVNTLTTVTKIVSGDSPQALDKVDALYSEITKTYRAATIKTAEAAKVIENTQRDVNIALMNELSAIFSRLNIDTLDVINAAASKWNFLKFQPGLVGGHCISVDPYYLTHRAQEAGYIPSLILAAREVNDQTPKLMAFKTIQALAKQGKAGKDCRVQILGVTFKEGVPDIRNSKVISLIHELESWGLTVCVWDPEADAQEVAHEYGVELRALEEKTADAVILAVPHHEFVKKGWNLVSSLLKKDGALVVTDLKGILPVSEKPAEVTLLRP